MNCDEGDELTLLQTARCAMTEQEWLDSSDPVPMLVFVLNKASRRKLQLFACACCRCIWKLLDDESRAALEAEESLASGSHDALWRLPARTRFLDVNLTQPIPTGPVDVRGFGGTADQLLMNILALGHQLLHNQAPSLQQHARRVVRFALNGAILEVVDGVAAIIRASEAGEQQQKDAVQKQSREQVCLLREILGNPFRESTVAAAWLTADVLMLARGISEERAFERLPILADALQEAGCDDQDILEHCRNGGPHHPACWVMDLIFRREMLGEESALPSPSTAASEYSGVYEEDPTDMYCAPEGQFRVMARLHSTGEDYLVGDFATRQDAARWALANVSTQASSRTTFSVCDDSWRCVHSITYSDLP
jgi:hypothetical protein